MYRHFWLAVLLDGTTAGHDKQKAAGSIEAPAALRKESKSRERWLPLAHGPVAQRVMRFNA